MPPARPDSAGAPDRDSARVVEQDRRAAESRRAFPRIPCRVLVDYVIDGAAHRDCIANISEGGAFIETSNPIEAGSPITLCFSLFQEKAPIKVVGEVAWTGATGVGVRFHQNQAIAQFCTDQGNHQAQTVQDPPAPRLPAPGPWDRRATDMRPYPGPRRPVTTVPLWVALSLLVALAVVSRYDTNARIEAVADKVDRASQSLVQLQSMTTARATKASDVTPVQAANPAPPAPALPSEPAPVRAESRVPQPQTPAAPPAAPAQVSVPGPPPSYTPPTSGTIYVVQAGDTLYRIALRFDVSQKALTESNRLAEPNRILVGQRIRIPE